MLNRVQNKWRLTRMGCVQARESEQQSRMPPYGSFSPPHGGIPYGMYGTFVLRTMMRHHEAQKDGNVPFEPEVRQQWLPTLPRRKPRTNQWHGLPKEKQWHHPGPRMPEVEHNNDDVFTVNYCQFHCYPDVGIRAPCCFVSYVAPGRALTACGDAWIIRSPAWQ